MTVLPKGFFDAKTTAVTESGRSRNIGLLISLVLLCPPGCLREPTHGIRVASARELDELWYPDTVTARDGGFSAFLNGSSVWVFGDTVLAREAENGTSWRSSTWSWTGDTDAADGLTDWHERADRHGAPAELFPFTEAEQLFNQRHSGETCSEDCGSRYGLWPGPVILDPTGGRALVFYFKVLARPTGPLDFDILGTSIAVWPDTETTPERPTVRPGTKEPTLLFQDGEPLFGAGAVAQNGWLYAYGCEAREMRCPCRVARAPRGRVLKRDTWELFDGDGGWSPDTSRAVFVFDGAQMMTVHWNEYLGAFLAVYSVPLRNDIVGRIAPHPWGPWSKDVLLHRAEPPSDPEAWSYSGLAHPELAKQDGKVEYLTYYRPGKGLTGEMRLVEVTFR